MKLSHIKQCILAQFATTNRVSFLLEGPPGGGKSALAFEIGREGINGKKFDNVVVFNASLRDPVDLMGTPNNTGEVTKWVPPKELHTLSKGRNLFIIEELTDCAVPMQNGLCCVIYDRKLNDLVLSDETYIIATGNRTEDKSGAQRLTTKLGNRMRIMPVDVNLDDWCTWALDNGVSPIMIQFLRFKPKLLLDFNPNNKINPTPRSWERASLVPDNLPNELFFASVAGDVGEGAAAEFTAFRKIYLDLPNIDDIIMEPKKAKVPDDPAVMYALTGALAHRTNADNFDRVAQFGERMKPDFYVMLVTDAIKLCPEIKKTKAFVNFAVKNANLLI